MLLRCEFQITLTHHTSKHRRGIVALYYIDCRRRRRCRSDSEHGRGNSSVNSSVVSFQISRNLHVVVINIVVVVLWKIINRGIN